MKLFKRLSTRKQRLEASALLVEIAELTNMKEAVYYEKELLPYSRKNGYDKYLELLKSVKYQIETGQRARKAPITIVCTAVNKVLT